MYKANERPIKMKLRVSWFILNYYPSCLKPYLESKEFIHTAYTTKIQTKLIIDPCWAIQKPKGAFPIVGIYASSQSRKSMAHPKLKRNHSKSKNKVTFIVARRCATRSCMLSAIIIRYFGVTCSQKQITDHLNKEREELFIFVISIRHYIHFAVKILLIV